MFANFLKPFSKCFFWMSIFTKVRISIEETKHVLKYMFGIVSTVSDAASSVSIILYLIALFVCLCTLFWKPWLMYPC